MKHQILLLEDSFLNRELLCDWLEGEGYEVVVAEDLNTGLAAVRDHSPDLVLLDVQLGADDGLTACVGNASANRRRGVLCEC